MPPNAHKNWEGTVKDVLEQCIKTEVALQPYTDANLHIKMSLFYGLRGLTINDVEEARKLQSTGNHEQRRERYWEAIEVNHKNKREACLLTSGATDDELNNISQPKYDDLNRWADMRHVVGDIVERNIPVFTENTVRVHNLIRGTKEPTEIVIVLKLGAKQNFLSKVKDGWKLTEKGKEHVESKL